MSKKFLTSVKQQGAGTCSTSVNSPTRWAVADRPPRSESRLGRARREPDGLGHLAQLGLDVLWRLREVLRHDDRADSLDVDHPDVPLVLRPLEEGGGLPGAPLRARADVLRPEQRDELSAVPPELDGLGLADLQQRVSSDRGDEVL